MKKVLIFIIFTAVAVSSFAQELQNRRLFIDGTALNMMQLEYFLVNFRREAIGSGFTLADSRRNAGFIYEFTVTENPEAVIDQNQFVMRIRLLNNNDIRKPEDEVVCFDFYFNSLEEMHEHNQFLFSKAAGVIPPLTEDSIYKIDTEWKDKWVYFRMSFDHPVSFYLLRPDGLYDDVSVWWGGSINDPHGIMPLDNKNFALPGFTLGIEIQFLNFMSFELNLKGYMGDLSRNEVLNMGMGAQLNFPIKYFRLFVIQPYAAALLPYNTSSLFTSYPSYLLGGGIQINAKGGKSGAFFIDINYMTAFSDAVIDNPYKSAGFEFPNEIHYRPFFIGLGIGYKYGIIDRPRKKNHPVYYDAIYFIEVPVQEEEPEAEPEPQPQPETGNSRRRVIYF